MNIPKTAYVPCPALGFKSRSASKCPECPHFQGLVDTNDKAPASMPFEQRYRVGCAHLIARRMTAIEVE